MAKSGSILCTPSYSLGCTLAPSGCLCIANLRSLPGSIHWSSSFSTQTPVSTTDMHLGLETASEVARTICADLCLFCLPQPATAVSSEPQQLPVFHCWSPSRWRGFPWWRNLSSFTDPSQGCRFCPDCFPPPHLPYLLTWWSFLQFWSHEIFTSIQ